MGIYKRAHIRGMVHELTRQGFASWPSKVAMDEAADGVADSFPDEEIPEATDQAGLTEEQAGDALERIIEVSQDLGEKAAATGMPPVDMQKQAAAQSFEDTLSNNVVALLEKAAAETAVPTGPDIPGSTPPTPELDATAEGEVDAATNPSSAIVVPQGTTSLNTSPGEVGKQERRPDQPGAIGSSPVNEAAKTASLLAGFLNQLDQGGTKVAEMDGASLSGGEASGPVPESRVDVNDNLDIPGVKAPGVGKTVMEVPANAAVGVTKAQPGGTPGVTSPTPNEPAKDAKTAAALKLVAELQKTATGQAILQKLAEKCSCDDEEKDKKDKKDKKDEKDEKDSGEKKKNIPPQFLAKSEPQEKDAGVLSSVANLLAALS